MENRHTSKNHTDSQEKSGYVNLKFKKPKLLVVVIGSAVILVLVVLFFAKGIFVAATVNGSPISRLSVISELEKRGGKSALDALISEKLIENEAAKKGVAVTDVEVDEEMEKIEAQITAQGSAFEEALAQQGLTEELLKEEIRIQQLMQKLLADKIAVTNEEVEKYITDNKVTLPKGEEQTAREQIMEQLKDQKLNQEAQLFITNFRNSAKIKYYVNY